MAAQIAYASANCDITATLASDPEVKFPQTVLSLRRALRCIQDAMSDLLHELPAAPCHENVSWLLLNGCVEVYRVCEPLATLGFADKVLEFLTWAVLVMEAVVTLSATKYLRWRMRLYATVCYCYEDLGKLRGATECLAHARRKVAELRKLEEYDPPLPARTEQMLRSAEGDLALLGFKYDVAMNMEAPLPPPEVEDGELARVPPALLQLSEAVAAVCPSAAASSSSDGGEGGSESGKRPTVARSRAGGFALLKWMSAPASVDQLQAAAADATAGGDEKTGLAKKLAAAALKGIATPAARWAVLTETLGEWSGVSLKGRERECGRGWRGER